MTAGELIKSPRDLRPHVVLLGAGASRAAFPNGDAVGRKLPVMNDIVDVLGLGPLLKKTGSKLDPTQDFEATYSRLCLNPEFAELRKEIEYRVTAYFSQLCLPRIATIYDCLLLSLKQTDAVFTFNWDPFLFDSYQRNRTVVPLPEIFFLHGNVRIRACPTHDCWGDKGGMVSILW